MMKIFIKYILLILIIAACNEPGKEIPQQKTDLKEDTVTANDVLNDSAIGQINDNSILSIPKQEKEKKYYKGRVMYLSNIFLENYAPMEKSMLKLLATKGQPIVFMTGEGSSGTIYFVFNSDMQPAVKILAEYSDSKLVSIYGKVVILNGLNILIAEKIERIK